MWVASGAAASLKIKDKMGGNTGACIYSSRPFSVGDEGFFIVRLFIV